MIAKQAIGKSFGGALNYNLKKLYSADHNNRAELLATNFLSLDQIEIKMEVAMMKALNPNLKRNTCHTSLNFSIDEKISNKKMEAIAKEYMEKMGFDNNPYFIFRHNDTEHPHCHILTLRNRFDGTVVSDSNNYTRSEAVVRELEEKYSLVKVISSKESLNAAPNKDELEMINRTGKVSGKMLMQEKIADAITNSKNISHFIAKLEQSGINPLFNQAKTGRVSGITYVMPKFKARGQALGNQFKWGSIIKEINYEQIRDSKEISQANSRTREKYGLANRGGNSINETGLSADGTISIKDESYRDGPIQNDGIYKGEFTDEERERNEQSKNNAGTGEATKGAESNGSNYEDNLLYDSNSLDSINNSWLDGFNLSIANDEDDSLKRKNRRR